MGKKKLKVLHGFVNYGTQAGYFARQLRAFGIPALSVSGVDRFDREIDFTYYHGGPFFVKFGKHLLNYLLRIKWFFTFNTFHFYYGTSLLPFQLDLPLYRLFGKRVVMEYLGNEIQLYRESVARFKWTNMVHFIPESEADSYDAEIFKRHRFESRYLDLRLACAPIYSEFSPGSIVLPLVLDLEKYKYAEPPQGEVIRIMHAPTSRGFKGTPYVIKALENLKSKGYPIEVMLVENISHASLLEEYKKCDLFIDQLMAGWYGTAAIEAMAIGRPVICSVRKFHREMVDYGNKIPILDADPDTIEQVIEEAIQDKTKLIELGLRSRQFVEEVHDLKKVTKKLIGYYESVWN